MGTLEDDTEHFVHLRISGSECDSESDLENVSTPATPRSPSPAGRKTKTLLRCPYDGCEKSYNRQARLTEHLRSHTNTRPFRCPHAGCSKDFLRDSHLKHHIKSAHTDIRDHVCPRPGCGKSFATGTRLKRHVAAHEGKEKNQCTGYAGCSQTFRKRDTLERHIKTVHEGKSAFPCTESDTKTGQPCKSGFGTAEKLRAHQRAKHDQTRFACTECLRKAQADDESDYEEDEDNDHAFFSTYADLQLHIATVHPPTCPHCPTILGTARELKRHLELVHEIKDPEEQQISVAFPCHYSNCNRSFSKKGNLNVHIKTVHEKRRDFVCGETELSMQDLLDTLTVGAMMEIEGCGRDFTSKSSLEEHVRTAHFGLGSKRVEREKKRKADREAAALEFGDEPEQKKKKSRKGQGKKNNALSTLTGLRAEADHDDAEMGELTGFETMVDGQIFGQGLGFTDRMAYAQHTYNPDNYMDPAAHEQNIYVPQGYTAAADHDLFEPADLFRDAEFITPPPLDPLLLYTS